MSKLLLKDMSICFGESNFDNQFIDLFNKFDWEYKLLDNKQQMSETLNLLQYIRSDKQQVSDPTRKQVWSKGWEENLQAFLRDGNTGSLIPKFFKKELISRLHKQLIYHKCDTFILNFFTILQNFIFKKYFSNYDNIYEFGCGSGINIVSLHQMFPDKKLYGCDFVQPSIDIINILSKKLDVNANGVLFDMSNPSYGFKIVPNSCVLTSDSIEQIPNGFRKFIDYLVYNKVELCCHIEPCIEMYDENNIVDMTAILFHEKRGYTIGLLPYLTELETEGKINIIHKKRTFIGTQRMEGFNVIMWETKK